MDPAGKFVGAVGETSRFRTGGFIEVCLGKGFKVVLLKWVTQSDPP
jgi:hypothetical protein